MFAEIVPRLLQPILLCLGAGLICWILGRRLPVLSRIVSLVAAVVASGQCCAIWRAGQASWSPAEPWMSFGAFDVQVSLAVTGLSGILALAASGFAILVLLYAWPHPVAGDGKFHAYALWSLAAAVGAFWASDLLFLLVCWEFLTLCLYLLIGQGDEETAPAGAAKAFAILGFSDCCMLLAVALVLATQGTLSMAELSMSTGSAAGAVTYLLFLCAALAKAGAVPVHSWIPSAAEGAPAAVMAYIPAALDKLLGIYLLARATLDLFVVGPRIQALLMIIGAVTVLAAVFMAMNQHNLKKLLSFHAVSQVGYMVLGIGTGTAIGIVGGLFHMVNHAVYKSCLFLCAGAVEERTGEVELDRLGGLARRMPVAFVSCAIAAMAISGVPPLNGFVSKWMVYQGALSSASRLAPLVLVAAVFGSALTLASFVKVIHSCYFGAEPEGLRVREARGGWLSNIPLVVLAALCVAMGLWARVPVAHLGGIVGTELGAEVTGLAQPLDYATGLWSPGAATVLILVGVLMGLVVYVLGRGLNTRTTGTFACGEILPADAVRYAGTSFYETIRQLPGLRGLFADGESGAYDGYYVAGRYGLTLVELLRRLHTGVLLVYVAWCVVGMTLILLYLNRG